VGPIYAVLRYLKLKSLLGTELHFPACGLWVGPLGALYAVLRNLKVCARSLEIELE